MSLVHTNKTLQAAVGVEAPCAGRTACSRSLDRAALERIAGDDGGAARAAAVYLSDRCPFAALSQAVTS